MVTWNEPSEPAEPKSRWGRIAFIALALFALVLLGVIFFGWLKDFLIFGTFNFVVDKFVDATGMSQYLVKGILVVVMVPFFVALREIGKIPLFKGLGKLSKNVAWGIVIGYTSAYFLAMYFATKDTYFHHTGNTLKAAKWFAITPEGVRFFDTEGFDPKYGIKLNPVTPQVVANLERMKRGDVAKPLVFQSISEVSFFDPQTGQPKVWYARSATGEITLFSTSGFDPLTGEELKPANPLIVEEVARQRKDVEARKLASEKEAQEAAKSAAADSEKKQLEAQEKSYRDRYVNPLARKSGTRKSAALLVLGMSDNADALKESISSAFKEKGVETTESLFRPDFVGDGSAARLFGGDWAQARRLRLSDQVDVIFLVRASQRTTVSDQGEGLRTTALSLDMKCIDVANQKLYGSRSVAVKGVGFSDADALRGSVKKAGTEIQTFVKSLGL
jgi:hypothetical protein